MTQADIRVYTNAESTFSDVFCRHVLLCHMLACDLSGFPSKFWFSAERKVKEQARDGLWVQTWSHL